MVVGVIAGYFYWYLFGCTKGCAITSKWYGSMFFGGLLGNLIGSIISDLKLKYEK